MARLFQFQFLFLLLSLLLVVVGVRSSFGRWYVGMFKRMFVGKGRSSRKEYWLFHLLAFISVLLGAIFVYPRGFYFRLLSLLLEILLDGIRYSGDFFYYDFLYYAQMFFILAMLLYLVFLSIASVTVTVRRLHDSDKSALYLLFYLLPFFGPIVVFVLSCLAGTQGPNQYGADPLTSDFEPTTPPHKNQSGHQFSVAMQSTGAQQDQLTEEAPPSPTYDDPEVVELRKRLTEAEKAAAERRAPQDLQHQQENNAGSQTAALERIDALERIAKLKNQGLLTDQEVEEAKRQLLSDTPQNDTP